MCRPELPLVDKRVFHRTEWNWYRGRDCGLSLDRQAGSWLKGLHQRRNHGRGDTRDEVCQGTRVQGT